jgi:Ion channel
MTALLVILIATIFVVPTIFANDDTGRIANDISITLLLICAAAAFAERRAVPVAAVILCGIAAALRWSEWVVPSAISPLVREGSALTALLLLIVIVGIRVFAGGTVIADRIIGAVVLYLLLGVAWAVAYELVALHTHDAFAGTIVSRHGPERWLYFSFVTLTTVGYGDIAPIDRAARSLAVLEALVGQLYPAVILARLVSLRA